MTTVDQPSTGRVTIYDVAKRAGVSIATVSHSLNRPEKVSPATRQRVLDAVDAMQFVPKETAVTRARRGVGRIGVLAPFSSYASYRDRLAGLLTHLAGEATEVVVFDHFNVAEATSPLLQSLPTTGRVDGLIIMGIPLDQSLADRLQQRGLPTVLVDSAHPTFSSVNIDDELGGRLLAEHLVDQGATSFAFLSEAQASGDYLSAGQARLAGIRSALEPHGLGLDDTRLVTAGNHVSGGREAAARLMALDPPPDAIVAHQDTLAAGLLQGLAALDRSVPSEVKVTGYDGGELAEALDLTTVRQPFAETGRMAAELLEQSIAEPSLAPRRITLAPELVVRATTSSPHPA
jgi:LacI family transcriptional regulator